MNNMIYFYPECNVEHGPVLGEVDLLAGEHRVATGRNIAALGLKTKVSTFYATGKVLYRELERFSISVGTLRGHES